MDPDPPQTRTVPEDSRAQAPGQQPAFAPGEQVAEGLVVAGRLGAGATGEVLAVHDLSLDREVAMKVLRGAGGPTIARFMREARITARLDHPNVPPVYTLDFLPDGGLIFTMRKLAGLSLGESLRRQLAGEAQPAIATVNAVVSLALRVCDALSRAHALGIVHRDVKPDNVMLGSDGEVALVDWGECRLLSEPDTGPAGSTVGTPAYMSPEQARGESADQRSDIYAVGATFWHVLTGSFPCWHDDPERFWERKRRGELDPLPATVRVPRPLLAILRRALAANPAGRYASVRELAADIERFQAGQAVAAYHASAPERVWLWLRRHRGPVLAVAAVLLVAAAGAALLWREHRRQVGEWGEPVLVEDFAGEGWRERWLAWPEGSFTAVDDGLATRSPNHAHLTLRQALSGAVAIEYDGWYEPEARPGDLSVTWHEDPQLLQHPEVLWQRGRPRPYGYWLQAGSWANNFCCLYAWPGGVRLDKAPLRLDPQARHRFRAELDGTRMRLWVDGRLTLEHEALVPISTGHLGLYGYYGGKVFANVRIWQKRLPEVAPVTLAADALLARRLYAAAGEEYAKVAASHAGRTIAVDARYRQGLAAWLDGRRDEAEAVWAALPPGEQADRAAAHRLDRLVDDGRVAEACAGLQALVASDPAVTGQLRQQWGGWAQRATSQQWVEKRRSDAEALVAACLAAFPAAGGIAGECGALLNELDRHAEVVRLFPDELLPTSDALFRLGRPREALERFGSASWTRFHAMHELGAYPEILAGGFGANERNVAACRADRAAEWLDRDGDRALKLLHLGRLDEVLADPEARPSQRVTALWHLGRHEEALLAGDPKDDRGRLESMLLIAGRGPDPLPQRLDPKLHAWVMADAAARGDLTLLARTRALLDGMWPDWWRWQLRYVIEPAVAARLGERGLLRARMQEAWDGPREVASQRAWHLAGYVLGHLDAAAVRRQPWSHAAEMWLAVGDALRAALAGEAVDPHWQRFLALPSWRRMMQYEMPEPGLERLAQWLSVPPAPAPAR